MIPSGRIGGYKRFGGTYSLYLQVMKEQLVQPCIIFRLSHMRTSFFLYLQMHHRIFKNACTWSTHTSLSLFWARPRWLLLFGVAHDQTGNSAVTRSYR